MSSLPEDQIPTLQDDEISDSAMNISLDISRESIHNHGNAANESFSSDALDISKDWNNESFDEVESIHSISASNNVELNADQEQKNSDDEPMESVVEGSALTVAREDAAPAQEEPLASTSTGQSAETPADSKSVDDSSAPQTEQGTDEHKFAEEASEQAAEEDTTTPADEEPKSATSTQESLDASQKEDPLAQIRERTASLGESLKSKLASVFERLSAQPSEIPSTPDALRPARSLLTDRLKFNMSLTPSPATPIKKAKENYDHIPMLFPDAQRMAVQEDNEWFTSLDSQVSLENLLLAGANHRAAIVTCSREGSQRLNFADARRTVDALAAALSASLESGATVACVSDSREEIILLAVACFRAGLTFAPLPSNVQRFEEIISDISPQAIFCSGNRMSTLSSALQNGKGRPQMVITTGETVEGVQSTTIDSLTQSAGDFSLPTLDDNLPACILFDANGSGAVLTRAQFSKAVTSAVDSVHELSADDVLMVGTVDLCLPTHFTYAVAALGAGASLGFVTSHDTPTSGDLVEITKHMKPTLVLMDSALAKTAEKMGEEKEIEGGYLRKYIFLRAFEEKKAAQARGIETPFWDFLLVDKTKVLLGGNVRLVLSTASLSAKTQDYLRVILDAQVLRIFGLAATGGVCFTQLYNDFAHQGSVGTVAPGYRVRLVEGNLCIRGDAVSNRLVLPSNNSTTTEDGWYSTGIIASAVEESPIFSLTEETTSAHDNEEPSTISSAEKEEISESDRGILDRVVEGVSG